MSKKWGKCDFSEFEKLQKKFEKLSKTDISRFCQDVAFYLNKYNICVRAGNHCAKILKSKTGVKNSLRISLYFYNTYEEIDKFVELISDKEKIMKEMI